MITTMERNDTVVDGYKWWEHPDRNCIDDLRFTAGTRGTGAKPHIDALIELCEACPVLAACRADAYAFPRTVGVVQGGKWWGGKSWA